MREITFEKSFEFDRREFVFVLDFRGGNEAKQAARQHTANDDHPSPSRSRIHRSARSQHDQRSEQESLPHGPPPQLGKSQQQRDQGWTKSERERASLAGKRLATHQPPQ